MTASTTGFVCSSSGVSSAAMRSSARATSRAEYKRRALRRTSCTSAGNAGTALPPSLAAGSTLERELRTLLEGRDERTGFLPVGRGMKILPIDVAAPVQPSELEVRRRVDVALQRIEHSGNLLRSVAEQHEIAARFEREPHAFCRRPGDRSAGHAEIVGDHGALEAELAA